MEKKYLSYIIVILLITGFIGCIDNSIKNRFIGTWEMEEISNDESSTIRILWTFRENDTASMTSIYLFKDEDPETYMSSGTYNISDNELCLNSKNSDGDLINTCFEYVFTNDYKSLSLYKDGKIAFQFDKK